MKGSPDRIQGCTTTQFDGVIAVIDPDSSWVARWQRTCAYPMPRLTLAIAIVHPDSGHLTDLPSLSLQLNTCAGCMLSE